MVLEYLPETVFFSALIKKEHHREWQAILDILNRHNIKSGLLEGTLDIWCRDYMPIKVSDSEFVQFEYNSSYLQGPENDCFRTIPEQIPQRDQFKPVKSKIILDGGNVVRRKDKVIISERVKSDNPTWQVKDLHNELERLLKAEVLWIPDHGEKRDMTGHADGLVRFLDDSTLLVNDQTKDYVEWARAFKKLIDGKGYHFENVPFFTPDPDNDMSAIGIYLNFLEIANIVIVPVFYSDSFSPYFRKKAELLDEEVVKRFKEWFSGRIIEPVNISGIGLQGGLVNCITWDIKTPVPIYHDLKLVPIYASGDLVMLILAKDFAEGASIDDSYAVRISLSNLESSPALRGQNFLRFDPMEPIEMQERQGWIEKIKRRVPDDLINKMAKDIHKAFRDDESRLHH